MSLRERLVAVMHRVLGLPNGERAERRARLEELETQAETDLMKAKRALTAGERLHGYRLIDLRRR